MIPQNFVKYVKTYINIKYTQQISEILHVIIHKNSSALECHHILIILIKYYLIFKYNIK